ncbi:MAG: glycine betaine/L-proline transporter ATP-binding protein [Achromobacter mucicolens]|jgi:glycine betaine/proline transport system ATP-binding protein|uniref:quaternary amine ABC transporter ATP-binding protein n=1 Tax=Achromobacter TaxID=222 RepID=UPI00114DB216|nr:MULTISPECIES: glycine betaine/L-proline ABC transporter ATP-binding protein [Achromobacter]MDF2860916.1 glycine betaine/L-proline transporter ATP-binding protein [Achromobacter mucicolens]TQJ97038.1 glycine betaine/proline transport system ATP-binding protein [Achromobacter sp. SLBN-14]UAN05051.1 glycine betaine/L-proline ABC transporter ATP-binding protein [Achromobacter mucicolens]CAB3901933.1 Glycine betaine transport ATP-binding protein OpuAA [Achromobacter mucicolens]
MSKIEVKNIYKIFGAHPKKWLQAAQGGMSKEELLAKSGHTLGLRDISLSIEEGSIYVIMGLSGSGKSTLIRHFNRLIEPSAGHILVDGVDVVSLNKRDLEIFRQKKMSMVFQRFGLFPHRTVLDNAAYGLTVQGVGKAEREKRAREWLEQVGLSGFENQYPHQLSGGMQQRVGLARALATDAEILLMDEAFSALDPLIRREMQDQLLQLQAKLNKTIVFITHDLDEALRLGNRIAILKDGELVQEGTPEDILLNPANDYVQSFLQDVNRTKVLNATHAVNPARLTLTMRSRPAHAVDRMKALNYEYAPVLDGKRLAGVLTAEAAEKAMQEGVRDVSRFVEDLASVPATAGLGEVLAQLVHSDQPVAVTGEDDEFLGMLSRKKVVELVTPALTETQVAGDTAATPDAAALTAQPEQESEGKAAA